MAKATGLVCFNNVEVMERPRSDEARQLLLKVAKQVEPIMQKRKWNVSRLREIIPASPNLLGYNQNKGATIAIRLRRVRNEDSFFDFHHILGTMLHELCHIVHGPHNAQFYALLDELRAEVEALMDKGIVGLSAFESGSGHRLGGTVRSHGDRREPQLQAALKRQRIGHLMSSGRRLGGSLVGKDVKVLAAEAAERRAADDIWYHDEVEDCIGGSTAAKKVAAKEVLQEIGSSTVGQHEGMAGIASSDGALMPGNRGHGHSPCSPKHVCSGSGMASSNGVFKTQDAAGLDGQQSCRVAPVCKDLEDRKGEVKESGACRGSLEGWSSRGEEAQQEQEGGRKVLVIDLTNDDTWQDDSDDCLIVGSEANSDWIPAGSSASSKG